MNKLLRFKLLTKFTSLICSLKELMSGMGISARKGLLPFFYVGFFILLLLKPFSSYAQFPYNESFRNSTAANVVFGGGPPSAFLTAAAPLKLDADGQGYLRLTNEDVKQTGFVYSNNVFLGTFGLNIEFEYFTYQTSGNQHSGADGLCFFLFDAAVPNGSFNIGGFGGSLGYAQLDKNNKTYVGVSKGYLGIGIDEWGNFANANEEGRQGGPGQRSNSVTLRGAGNGSAFTSENYKWLTTVQTTKLTDNFNIAGGLRGATPENDGYRKVRINLVPRPGGGIND
ncbi:hypothetical protein H7F33_11505 [Pedobacter sp. PAMC26386]|nr:hypothetical protein H7F33_11505 [Pedobacter sp. PAMC26386]